MVDTKQTNKKRKKSTIDKYILQKEEQMNKRPHTLILSILERLLFFFFFHVKISLGDEVNGNQLRIIERFQKSDIP